MNTVKIVTAMNFNYMKEEMLWKSNVAFDSDNVHAMLKKKCYRSIDIVFHLFVHFSKSLLHSQKMGS